MARRWRSCCQWASPKPGRKSPARPLFPRGSSPPPQHPPLSFYGGEKRRAPFCFAAPDRHRRAARRRAAGGDAGQRGDALPERPGDAVRAEGCCGSHPSSATATRQERCHPGSRGGPREVAGGARQVPSPPPAGAEGPRSIPPAPPGKHRCKVWDRQGGKFLHPQLKSKPCALKIRSPLAQLLWLTRSPGRFSLIHVQVNQKRNGAIEENFRSPKW